jgi:hypothetical protein
VTAVDGTRPLDPDTLAALEEQRDFLLRSLEDLEREHDAGDVDDHDYASLKDDYTARAARSIRAIEAHHARVAAVRPRRSWPRTMAVLAGVVAFAVVAGVLVARFSGRREAGDALTGDIRESTRTQLDNARIALQQERYDDAIEIYDAVLADQPDSIEAMAYKGRAQIGNGDMEGVVTLIDAAEADPDYPTRTTSWPVRSPSPVATTRRSRSSTGSTRSIRPPTLPPRPTTCDRRSRRYAPRPRRRRPPPSA